MLYIYIQAFIKLSKVNTNSIYILVQKITQSFYGAKVKRIQLDCFIYANGITT